MMERRSWLVDGIPVESEFGVRMPDAEVVGILEQLTSAKKSLGLSRENISGLFIRKVSRRQRIWRRVTRYPIIDCLRCKTPVLMICVAFLAATGEERYYNDLMGWCPNCELLHFAAIPDED